MTETLHPADALGHIMGRHTRDAFLVVQAFTLLLPSLCDRESPHDWDEKPLLDGHGYPVIGEDGHPKRIRLFPAHFARRLVAAHAAGAFDRMTPEAIAERILTTDDPTDIPAGGSPVNMET